MKDVYRGTYVLASGDSKRQNDVSQQRLNGYASHAHVHIFYLVFSFSCLIFFNVGTLFVRAGTPRLPDGSRQCMHGDTHTLHISLDHRFFVFSLTSWLVDSDATCHLDVVAPYQYISLV